MVRAGQLLIAAGFVIGAAASVVQKETIHWLAFSIGMVLATAGIAMVHLGMRKEATKEERLTASINTLQASLATLAKHADELEQEKDSVFVYDLPAKIDALFPVPLDQFVQARKSMIHAFTMQDYADIMNHFAAGERSINRVWSASVDGYIDEAKTYLTKAATHFRDAQSAFQARMEAPA